MKKNDYFCRLIDMTVGQEKSRLGNGRLRLKL